MRRLTGRPAASGRRFRASHPIRSAPATTHGTRPGHGPCGSTRSEQCDRRNRSYRPANPDRECSARPSWTAGYRQPTPASNCPAGATFSQPGLRKSVAGYSNYEHEIIAERDGGLPPEKVEALIAGLPTSFEDPRQQVIYEITSALIAPRVVPTGLYRRAVELLGHPGLTDLTVLIGYFTCVSISLRAYDVPSSAVGLKR